MCGHGMIVVLMLLSITRVTSLVYGIAKRCQALCWLKSVVGVVVTRFLRGVVKRTLARV